MLTPTIKKFKMSEPQKVFECNIFSVSQQTVTSLDGEKSLNIHTLSPRAWINIVPVTAQGEIVFVEQHRFGSNEITFETPGGIVEPEEKDPTTAALREMEEETGLTSRTILGLPSYHANPAMQKNRMYYFIAFDVQPYKGPHVKDEFEHLAVHFVKIPEAIRMARTGQVTNSLSALALLLAEPYINRRFPTS